MCLLSFCQYSFHTILLIPTNIAFFFDTMPSARDRLKAIKLLAMPSGIKIVTIFNHGENTARVLADVAAVVLANMYCLVFPSLVAVGSGF